MNSVDVIIAGGGVGGLSCALFTSKAGLRTVVLNHRLSQVNTVKALWNVPGAEDGVSGEQWIQRARAQVEQHGGQVMDRRVESLSLEQQPYVLGTEDGILWQANHVVLAVNLGYELLSEHGFDLAINEHVPSKKIRKINGVGYDGKTHLPGVYAAGLLANIPSQTVIAAGQGAFVGVQIASAHIGSPYMWHD